MSAEPADTPSARGYRQPAEWAPHEATWLSWPHNRDSWPGVFAGVEPAMVDKMLGRPPVERKGAVGYGSYEDTLGALETALTPGPFILGERFSAVDVYVGSQIHWGLMVKALEPRPRFQQYADRIAARPALQRLLKGAQPA